MSILFKRLVEDFSGTINLIWETVFSYIRTAISTFFMKVSLLFKGIKFGKNIRFYGFAKVRRYINSEIVISSSCRFRSAEYSNFVGLNRKCMISTLNKGAKIFIGEGSGLSGTVIGCSESITIGKNVLLGANTTITDTDWHPLNRAKSSKTETAPVVIEDNVFIGLNTVVLKGSVIGRGSVIGANSVVAGVIPPNVVAAGNPCKVIREL